MKCLLSTATVGFRMNHLVFSAGRMRTHSCTPTVQFSSKHPTNFSPIDLLLLRTSPRTEIHLLRTRHRLPRDKGYHNRGDVEQLYLERSSFKCNFTPLPSSICINSNKRKCRTKCDKRVSVYKVKYQF